MDCADCPVRMKEKCLKESLKEHEDKRKSEADGSGDISHSG